MASKFRCMQCEKEESRCNCDRYCQMCQGYYDVRLCGDGIYYCRDCRQACGYKAEGEEWR